MEHWTMEDPHFTHLTLNYQEFPIFYSNEMLWIPKGIPLSKQVPPLCDKGDQSQRDPHELQLVTNQIRPLDLS